MNTNTTSNNNTSNHTATAPGTASSGAGTTSSGAGTASSGVGTKIKGAAEFVHGAGENLRGTVLGAMDTVTQKGSTRNDDIAQQGRLEMERGLAKMKGLQAPQAGSGGAGVPMGGNATSGVGPGSVATSQGAGYAGDKQQQGYGAGGQQAFNGGQGQDLSHQHGGAIPQAGVAGVAGLAASELHGGHAQNQHDPLGQNVVSQHDPSQANYRDRDAKVAPTGQPNVGATTAGYDQGQHGQVGQNVGSEFDSSQANHRDQATRPGYDMNKAGGQQAYQGGQGLSEPTHPNHHRDDAISGPPAAELQGGQAQNHHHHHLDQNAGSQYDPSQANYRNQATDRDAKIAPTGQANDGQTRSGYDQGNGQGINPVN